MFFHKAQEKPRLYGNFQDRQYSIWRNLEDIYRVDHESEALIMPLFWGLPCLDYSGNANCGTNYGATYKNGNLDFDGSNDYVSISNAWIYPVTINMWVNPIDFDTRTNYFDCGYDYNSDTGILLRSTIASTFEVKVGNDKEIYGDIIPTGTFTYLTVVIDSTPEVEVFINGISNGGGIVNSATAGTTSYLGAFGGSFNFYTGIIDEVRISNTARSADQIALFHDRPWDLYRPVSRPIYFIPVLPAGNPLWYYDMIGRQ